MQQRPFDFKNHHVDIEPINQQQFPNQAIWISLRNSTIRSIVFCLSLWIIQCSLLWIGWTEIMKIDEALISSYHDFLKLLEHGQLIFSKNIFRFLSFGMCISILGGIGFLGYSFIQHFALRWVLWRSKSIPWNYARFLQFAAEQRLLVQVGGGFRFMHDLLREYIAELE